jgi:hypothetical protein
VNFMKHLNGGASYKSLGTSGQWTRPAHKPSTHSEASLKCSSHSLFPAVEIGTA